MYSISDPSWSLAPNKTESLVEVKDCVDPQE